MMQTLNLLCIPVAGFAFHDDFPDIDLNPKGYFDLPFEETINGVNDERYSGMAVKLYGLQLARTGPEFIRKVIVCRRSADKAIESTMKLLDRRGARFRLPATKEAAKQVFYQNYSCIESYLSITIMPNINVLYEELVENPEPVIGRIADFLEISVDVKQAVSNVSRR
jgi:hypothetical protein